MSFVIDKTITDKPPKKRSFRSLLGTIVCRMANRPHPGKNLCQMPICGDRIHDQIPTDCPHPYPPGLTLIGA
jgi:hypothetical protein